MNKKIKVSCVRCIDYDQQHVSESIHNTLDLLGGLSGFVKEKDKVLLKLNLLQAAKPERAVTTHPAIVRAVIQEVKKIGAIPVVGDSPGAGNFKHILDETGVLKVCIEENVKWIELKKPHPENTTGGAIIKHFTLSQEMFEFDCIINMPKLKTHVLVMYTGAIKNLYGLIPGNIKRIYHIDLANSDDFSEMLLDLYLLVKPKLTIMDAVVGMDGQGPSSGNPKEIGYIFASEDALSLDTVATSLVGLKAPIISLAQKRKLMGSQLQDITLVGDHLVRVKDFKKPLQFIDMIPPFLKNILRMILTQRPVVVKENCVKCGMCAKICPRHSITMKNYPSFNYATCIRCYCCHEFCPHKAIILKKGLLLKLVKERQI